VIKVNPAGRCPAVVLFLVIISRTRKSSFQGQTNHFSSFILRPTTRERREGVNRGERIISGLGFSNLAFWARQVKGGN